MTCVSEGFHSHVMVDSSLISSLTKWRTWTNPLQMLTKSFLKRCKKTTARTYLRCTNSDLFAFTFSDRPTFKVKVFKVYQTWSSNEYLQKVRITEIRNSLQYTMFSNFKLIKILSPTYETNTIFPQLTSKI